MIAIDTSSLIAYFAGESGEDVADVDDVLRDNAAVLPPAVLSEFLSDPHLPFPMVTFASDLPLLEVRGGYWERAGRLRAAMISKGWNVLLADTLIAQSCIDHSVPLITRDRGFKAFERHAGLKLR